MHPRFELSFIKVSRSNAARSTMSREIRVYNTRSRRSSTRPSTSFAALTAWSHLRTSGWGSINLSGTLTFSSLGMLGGLGGAGGSIVLSNTRNVISSVELGGAGLLGRFSAGLAQCPRGGSEMLAFLHALLSATSETPISRASLRTGVDQARSNSSRAVKLTFLYMRSPGTT
ncbi:hypothetical protein EMIT0P12_10496 [Pseudomonas sp. IT-P12]